MRRTLSLIQDERWLEALDGHVAVDIFPVFPIETSL